MAIFFGLIYTAVESLLPPVNNLGAKVSMTQDCHFHPPASVPGRRERKGMSQYAQSYFGINNSNFKAYGVKKYLK